MSNVPFVLHTVDGCIGDWVVETGAYVSHQTGLRVSQDRTPRGAATEWTTFIENLGDELSPLINKVCFFRQEIACAADDVPVVHHGGGGVPDAVFPSKAWRIQQSEMVDWAMLKLEGAKGRCSNKDLPIFIVTDGADTRGTAFVAGYSGHVVNEILRECDYRSLEVSASVNSLSFQLPPKTRIRLGSMLVLPYEGDLDAGRNLLRRTLREQICPPVDKPRVTYVHWFGIERDYDAASLLREAKLQASLGTEVFELDAAWAMQGTHAHYGAGNWAHENREKFPAGIAAFAEEIRALGMRFGLWFEPETVEEGTAIHREHPEWLITLPGAYRYLFDFGNPEAAAYMTELVLGIIEAYGVAWIRMDSNVEPDAYWATLDNPGYRELLHWEGWYGFLDALLARFPDLHLEGCCSGGRRIDLEHLKRSRSFWISDNTNFAATVHQHIGGANHWLPSHLLNMEAVKYPLYPKKLRPYAEIGDETFSDFWLKSLIGGLFGLGGPHTAYPEDINARFAACIAQYKEVRHLLAGDFYPLLPQPHTTADWDAWQFHDQETNAGMILVFRYRGSRDTLNLKPKALKAGAIYQLSHTPERHRGGDDLCVSLACEHAHLITYQVVTP